MNIQIIKDVKMVSWNSHSQVTCIRIGDVNHNGDLEGKRTYKNCKSISIDLDNNKLISIIPYDSSRSPECIDDSSCSHITPPIGWKVICNASNECEIVEDTQG